MISDTLLRKIELRKDSVHWGTGYPFDLPVVRGAADIALHPQVTFLVGENGSGKSTLLEAVAVAWGLNAEGGSKNFRFQTRATHSDLFKSIRLVRGARVARDAYFLRAETLYNVATEAERLNVGRSSLHECSHGEAFLQLFLDRFRGNSFLVLDEPEAALSPTRQLAVLARMHQLVAEGSQFLVATLSDPVGISRGLDLPTERARVRPSRVPPHGPFLDHTTFSRDVSAHAPRRALRPGCRSYPISRCSGRCVRTRNACCRGIAHLESSGRYAQ
jgi:predicted ATPase